MTITLNEDYDVTLSTALLGYVGETNARPVTIEGMEIDGADRYVLTIDYGDSVQYEVDITGGQWTPTADILRAAQTVSCQIAAKKLSGQEYILVKKSRIFRLRIGAAIGDNAVPSPDVAVDALDRIDAIGRQTHADMQTAQAAAETATTAADNAAKSATAAGVSADTATQAAERAETAQTSAETSATQAETANQGAENARAEAVASQNNAKISAAQASTAAQQTTADKNITAGYAKTAKTAADSTAADRQVVQEMAAQVTADKATVADNAAQVATDRKAAETAAQTAQAIEDSLPDDYVTAVKKIAENTAEIANVKLTDKELQRRVNALYDMGNGITHRFETDSDTAYAKTVPTGGTLMSVKSVGGRSLVFNQLCSDFTYGGTKFNCKPMCSAHKYLCRIDCDAEQSTTVHMYFREISYTKNNQTSQAVKAGKSTLSWITSPYGDSDIGGVFDAFLLDNSVKVTFSNRQIFDLTTMFGAGNEPTTVEEFEKMFPADYYPYNAGEIISAGTEEVVEQGKNLLNADDYYISYKQSNGSYVNNFMGFASINIPVGKYIGKTLVATLKATVPPELTSFFWVARIDGARIESSYAKGERVLANTTGIAKLTFTPKTKNDTLAMSYGTGRGDVIVRDIQVELGDIPTAYAPFHRNVYKIPEAIKSLPGYGWSAGTARNYVDYENKRYVQCVNSADLGTKNWLMYKDGDYTPFFYLNSISDIRGGTSNFLCSKYQYAKIGVTDNASGLYVLESSTVRVRDTAYTDAATFKQAMSGVILYYELATPIVTDISDLIDDDFLRNISVEAGGSVTFKGSNDDYRVPVPSEEEYIVKLSEIGGSV